MGGEVAGFQRQGPAKRRAAGGDVSSYYATPYQRGSGQIVPGYTRRAGFYGFGRPGTGELKFLDTDIGDAAVTLIMTNHNLNVITQGDNEANRVGRKCTLRSVSGRITVHLPAATSAVNTAVGIRFRLVQDKQTNGADFAGTDLLDLDDFNSFSQLANRSRFRVIMDKTVMLNAGGAAPSGAAFVFSAARAQCEFHHSLNMPIEFDNTATTGAVATQRSNSLHLVT